MKARITIDGANVLTEETKEAARVAFLAIAKTANPIAKTAVNGIKFFSNPENVAAKLQALGKSDSVVEFYELPEGKTVERLAARYTLQNFVNRLEIAASAEKFVGEIMTDEPSKKDASGKPEQDRDL